MLLKLLLSLLFRSSNDGLANHLQYIILTPFHAAVHFYSLRKYQKTSSFLICSRGIERDQWHDVG